MNNPLWEGFLDRVRSAQQKLGCHEPGCREAACKHLWYRGHADSIKYKLLPTLLRFSDGLSKERTLFEKYELAALEILNEVENNSAWEMLFQMQHHYIPTRLLDWTSVLGVAVFFATINDSGQDPCIYVLNPVTLNNKALGFPQVIKARSEDFDYKRLYWNGEAANDKFRILPHLPIAVEPGSRIDRIRAQKAKFTCHNNDQTPLDEQYPEMG